MKKSNYFFKAKENITRVINKSKTPEDPSHAENVLTWLLVLEPDADEVLQLSAFGHDIERAMPDRYTLKDFSSYEEYKSAHAKRSGQLVKNAIEEAGYAIEDGDRAAGLVEDAEFSSDDPEVQLICDADTISFFDNNLAYYRKRYSSEDTKKKVVFMYERATPRAKKYVDELISKDEIIKGYLSS